MLSSKKSTAPGAGYTRSGEAGETELAPILAGCPHDCQGQSAGQVKKITRYIAKSCVPSNPRYDASFIDILALERELGGISALELAFRYGVAKGYRAAKAEVR